MDCWLRAVVIAAISIAGCGGDDGTAGSSSGEEGAGEDPTEGDPVGTTSSPGTTSTATSDGSEAPPGSSGEEERTGGPDCDCMLGAYAPVCGVDGMTYDSICGMECVPVDIACEGECPCTGFMCGEMACERGEQVCRTTTGGPAGSRPSYQCETVPEPCLPDPDCSCFPEIGCMCSEDPEDHFQIECFAP
jgi:hypothetical protein